MSVKIMGRVWELKLSHSHMLVLLAMADHADHEGDNIYPSIGLVAWKCGYSERQVQRVITELVESGILVEVSAKPGKRVIYRIDMEKSTPKPPYKVRQNVRGDKMSGVTSTTKRGDILSTHGVTSTTVSHNGLKQPTAPNRDPNHHHEPSIEPSSPKASKNGTKTPAGDGDEIANLLDEYNIGASDSIAQLYREQYPDIDVATIRQCVENLLADEVPKGKIVNRLRNHPPEPGKPYQRSKAPIRKSGERVAQTVNIAKPPSPPPDAVPAHEAARRMLALRNPQKGSFDD